MVECLLADLLNVGVRLRVPVVGDADDRRPIPLISVLCSTSSVTFSQSCSCFCKMLTMTVVCALRGSSTQTRVLSLVMITMVMSLKVYLA